MSATGRKTDPPVIPVEPAALPLGKKRYRYDERTINLVEEFVADDVVVPSNYDFDKNRAEIPLDDWGNLIWRNCVVAGEANHLLRLERVEQKRTISLTDDDVITRYKALTGSTAPGDGQDEGLVVLDAMKDWRAAGFAVTDKNNKTTNYTIDAFGEVDPRDAFEIRKAIHLFYGVHLGFWLPLAAQQMLTEGYWHYEGEMDEDWKPGTWGGHLAYAKKYEPDSVEIMCWGFQLTVSNSFIAKYCDEAWAVIDSTDPWLTNGIVKMDALQERLSEICVSPAP